MCGRGTFFRRHFCPARVYAGHVLPPGHVRPRGKPAQLEAQTRMPKLLMRRRRANAYQIQVVDQNRRRSPLAGRSEALLEASVDIVGNRGSNIQMRNLDIFRRIVKLYHHHHAVSVITTLSSGATYAQSRFKWDRIRTSTNSLAGISDVRMSIFASIVLIRRESPRTIEPHLYLLRPRKDQQLDFYHQKAWQHAGREAGRPGD